MIRKKANIITFISILFISMNGFAVNLFEKGMADYNQKNYKSAAKSFEEYLVENPDDVSAYYNLGISYMENEKFPDAIWSFEKVLKYSPNDKEVKEHLVFCNNEVNPTFEWNPRLNNFQAGLYNISSNTWASLAIAFSFLLCVFVVIYAKKDSTSTKKMMVMMSVGSLVLLVAFGTLSRQSYLYATETNFAVVTKKTIPTFDEDGKQSMSNIEEGTYLELKGDLSQDIIKVLSNDAEEYYVNSSDISFV